MLSKSLAILFIVSSSCSVQAQAYKLDPRLAGTWHSVEDRCAADEDCTKSANEAQLTIDKTGHFQWVQYRDLEKSEICSWRLSPDTPNTLDFEDCQVDPDGDSDSFVYRLSGDTLSLVGLEQNPTAHELITMRFKRGRLASDWREPSPEICDTTPLPPWTASAIQIVIDSDLDWPRAEITDRQRAIADRNRLLWDAVKAYEGKAPPIALKVITSTIEGDRIGEYLFASQGNVEVVSREDEGIVQHLSTCIERVPMMKLKVQDSGKVWRLARNAPSAATRAYLVFPRDDTDLSVPQVFHIFPRY